jgi:hypothetical protein
LWKSSAFSGSRQINSILTCLTAKGALLWDREIAITMHWPAAVIARAVINDLAPLVESVFLAVGAHADDVAAVLLDIAAAIAR